MIEVLREALDESCAVFCEPDDVDGWRRSLRQLENNTELRNRLARAGRDRASSFTWERRVERIVDHALENARRRRSAAEVPLA